MEAGSARGRWRTFPVLAVPAEVTLAWSRLVDGSQQFTSPYFHPAFARAYGRVFDNVFVTVGFSGDEPVVFFPYRIGRYRMAEPVGGPLSDYQGVVARPQDLPDAATLLRHAGVSGFRFDHLIMDQGTFRGGWRSPSVSPRIDLRGGIDAYLAAQERAQRSLADTNMKIRKLSRALGEPRFAFDDFDERSWSALLEWKRDQYRRTGAPDVLALPGVQAFLLELVRAEPEPSFRIVMNTLRVGDELLAVHYGMRSRDTLHYWLMTYATAHGRFSPGMILLWDVIRSLEAQGIRWLDFGKGDERYKSRLANDGTDMAEGAVLMNTPLAMAWQAEMAGRAGLQSAKGLAKKALRALGLRR